jgi:hypothetical protein
VVKTVWGSLVMRRQVAVEGYGEWGSGMVSGFRVGRGESRVRDFLVVSWKNIGCDKRDSLSSVRSCSFGGLLSVCFGLLICFSKAVRAFSSYESQLCRHGGRGQGT